VFKTHRTVTGSRGSCAFSEIRADRIRRCLATRRAH
jgi:hypothetical protein